MEVRQCICFLTVEEEGSYTRAAERLGVTQPALSHQMRKLEEEVGAALFDRVGRSIALNAAGKMFLPLAQSIVQQVDEARHIMADQLTEVSGILRVGTAHSFNFTHIPKLVGGFGKAHVDVRFEVDELLVPQIEDKLLRGLLDVGFSYFPARADGLEEHILYAEELAVFAPKNLELPQNMSFAELSTLPMALPSLHTQTRRIIEEYARQAGCVLRPLVESNVVSTNILIAREMGLITISGRDLLSEITGMKEVFIKDKMPIRQTSVLFRKGVPRTKLLRKFQEFVLGFDPSWNCARAN